MMPLVESACSSAGRSHVVIQCTAASSSAASWRDAERVESYAALQDVESHTGAARSIHAAASNEVSAGEAAGASGGAGASGWAHADRMSRSGRKRIER